MTKANKKACADSAQPMCHYSLCIRTLSLENTSVLLACEQQMRIPACASAQSAQSLVISFKNV